MLLKLGISVSIIVGLLTVAAEDNGKSGYEKEDGVVVLNQGNYDQFHADNPTVLVLFYAPWDDNCKKLLPEYAEMAKKLKIPVAKVDLTVEGGLAAELDINGFPVVRLQLKFREPEEYKGEKNGSAILKWVNERLDPNYVLPPLPPENVVTLTGKDFDKTLKDVPLALVAFIETKCSQCKKLAPQYEKAAKKLKEKQIMLAKINCAENKNIAERYHVTSYPSLKVMRYGKPFNYEGPRYADGIVDHMQELTIPAAKQLQDLKNSEMFILEKDITILGFFSKQDSPLLEALKEAAEMSRKEFQWIGYFVTKDPKVFNHFDVSPNTIIVLSPKLYLSENEPKRHLLRQESAKPEELLEFFREYCRPLVGQLTYTNLKSRYTKRPLVVVYYNVDFSLDYREGTKYWWKKVKAKTSVSRFS
ncbi:hypothetical protein AB6A40_009948 [Gnathostoma spinigerum]|uniref:Thioredoxin domain-containing protein n=1 Tax=Gnathostoma spinigerum TaxID=75299 RepID=A0ABD6F0J8_9BILA